VLGLGCESFMLIGCRVWDGGYRAKGLLGVTSA